MSHMIYPSESYTSWLQEQLTSGTADSCLPGHSTVHLLKSKCHVYISEWLGCRLSVCWAEASSGFFQIKQGSYEACHVSESRIIEHWTRCMRCPTCLSSVSPRIASSTILSLSPFWIRAYFCLQRATKRFHKEWVFKWLTHTLFW